MRGFVTFLSLFTLLFFLAPILYLSNGESTGETPKEEPAVSFPEWITIGGQGVSAADYLTGRLAALGVQGYHPEGLKAVVVAEASRMLFAPEENWYTPEEAKLRWGDAWFARYWPELQQAVANVWGQTLHKNGVPIDAETFPLSWGVTAEGIECPYDFTAEGFETEISLSLSEVQAIFPRCTDTLTVKKARTGRVETVTSGDTALSGEEVAQRLGLPSLCFSITVSEQTVTILCKGKGNGNGMSLYGANELAKRGADYETILKTFFPAATVRK